MSELMKLLLIVALLVSLAFSTLGYNLYTNAENRKLYAECLKLTERLLDADPKRISTPFCSLR